MKFKNKSTGQIIVASEEFISSLDDSEDWEITIESPIVPSIEAEKYFFLKELSELFQRKVLEAKKEIIEKPWLSDKELATQLKVYEEKYQDAKDGIDVFEAQSAQVEVSQEVFRGIVIQKGDEFKLAEKRINDKIESVRQVLERKIQEIKTKDDTKKIKDIFVLINNFSISTPLTEIISAIKT